MGLAHILPRRFLVKGLEQFLVGDESLLVRNQTELIRSVPQHIDEKPAQPLCPYLLMSSAQDDPPIEDIPYATGASYIRTTPFSSTHPAYRLDGGHALPAQCPLASFLAF